MSLWRAGEAALSEAGSWDQTAAFAFAPMAEQVRRAKLDNEAVALRALRPAPGPAHNDPGALVLDEQNRLADVDARLDLLAIGRLLAKQGWRLPLPRPLPAVPLWRLAAMAPVVVEALLHSATLLTVDGDPMQTPSAPRHSAGPSLLHGVCSRPPLCFLARARLRVVPAATTSWDLEHHDDEAAAAARLVQVAAEGRALLAAAFGVDVLVLRGHLHGEGASSGASQA
jgi:hypothetical protein